MTRPLPSVAAALAAAKTHGLGRLDAQLMLARLMSVSRTWLIAHDDAPLGAEAAARWPAWIERRSAGEPLAYLLGEKEFRGLMLDVTPAVLVPRPETELLVDWADELLGARTSGTSIVDLGTGSGAIALAIKHGHPGSRVLATDSSAAALAVARGNARRLALEVEFVETSWWQGLDGRRFDLALANPPYVAGNDAVLATLRHEPIAALTPGGDGLSALATIIAGASQHLATNGWLILEHGFDQGAAVRRLLADAGLANIATRHDLAGQARATGARRGRPPA